MKWPAYPSYRPSEAEWLGDVPEHWAVVELRRVSKRIQTGSTPPTSEERYYEDGTVPWFGPGSFDGGIVLSIPTKLLHPSATREGAARLFEAGSTMVVTIGATLGKVASLAEPGSCNQQVTVVEFDRDSVYPRFGSYLMKRMEPALRATAPSATLPILSQGDLASIAITRPPLPEQRAIADFLDTQTAKIDTLVAKKRALIEKLAEKRSALISRTVTRGLPAEVARAACLEAHSNFKTSGIEWLGDVPTEWRVAQLRRSCVVLDCKHKTVSFVDDGVPLASIGEVHGFAVDLSTAKQTTEDEYFEMIEGDRRPQLGDIIYSRNATVGDAALVTTAERFCMGQDVCLIRPSEHHPRFLLYLFRSASLLEQVESLMIGSTFRRINVGQIKAFWICLPPAPEQGAIADFLERETAKIDALVTKVEAAIDRLQEYRAALITAAVTGKIDVRGAVPPFTGSTPSGTGATPPA